MPRLSGHFLPPEHSRAESEPQNLQSFRHALSTRTTKTVLTSPGRRDKVHPPPISDTTLQGPLFSGRLIKLSTSAAARAIRPSPPRNSLAAHRDGSSSEKQLAGLTGENITLSTV